MMKHFKTVYLVTLFFAISCKGPKTIQQPEVKHYGALKLMMHQGDIKSKFDLSELDSQANIYALGAIENLKGEILIHNSDVMLSKEGKEGKILIEDQLKTGASLLVVAEVPEWDSIMLPDSVNSQEVLEEWIESIALKNGFDTEKPFPFLLKGKIDWLQWHVINWPEGDTEHSHQKHLTSGPHGKISDEEVSILGFYSKHHHAIFTHHSTNMHMHFHNADKTLAAHVDSIGLKKGMWLFLPGI